MRKKHTKIFALAFSAGLFAARTRNTQRSETMQICMGNVQMLRDKKPFFQSGADCAIIFTNTAILNKKLEKSGGFFVSLTPTHSISISYSARIGKGIVRSTRGFLACCP
jgi:hypothetical protein